MDLLDVLLGEEFVEHLSRSRGIRVYMCDFSEMSMGTLSIEKRGRGDSPSCRSRTSTFSLSPLITKSSAEGPSKPDGSWSVSASTWDKRRILMDLDSPGMRYWESA